MTPTLTMKTETLITLSPEQEKELRLMKSRLPYRISYAALHPETREFFVSAVFDMRKPNAFARKGYAVFTL